MVNHGRAYGAYQTPPALARQVCSYLYEVLGLRPSVVVEPTCGVGHLMEAALRFCAARYLGIELNADYVEQARAALGADARVRIVQGDILTTDVRALLGSAESVLILGNPPWVNRATRGALGAAQRYAKCTLLRTAWDRCYDRHDQLRSEFAYYAEAGARLSRLLGGYGDAMQDLNGAGAFVRA